MVRSEFDEWFAKWTGSKVKCENTDIIAAWQHQQSKVDELQKRVDAVKQLIQEYRDPPTEDKTFCHALSIVAYELEQALKGDQ